MVRGQKRSRTFRRIAVKTPGGRTTMHYRLRAPSKARCGSCGGFLAGVARGRAAKLNKLSKTERRPERPFGGVLCSSCMRIRIKSGVRAGSQ